MLKQGILKYLKEGFKLPTEYNDIPETDGYPRPRGKKIGKTPITKEQYDKLIEGIAKSIPGKVYLGR